MTTRQFAILSIVGGVLAAVGSLLPWATIMTGIGTIGVAGTSGDGVITLILGVAAALIGFVRFGGTGPPLLAAVGTILGVAVIAIGAFDYLNVQGRLGGTEVVVTAEVGVGLYLVILGGVLVLFGGMKGKAEPTVPPSP